MLFSQTARKAHDIKSQQRKLDPELNHSNEENSHYDAQHHENWCVTPTSDTIVSIHCCIQKNEALGALISSQKLRRTCL